jgi:hypothetical protein
MNLTLLTATFGDCHRFRRLLESVEQQRGDFEFIVGNNGSECEALLCSHPRISKVVYSPINIQKTSMQARLLQEVKTDWVFWVDDDIVFVDQFAVEYWMQLASQCPVDVAAIGNGMTHLFRASSLLDHFPEMAGKQWDFLSGGAWMGRMDALRNINWPPAWLVFKYDDVVMSELLRRAGYKIQVIGFPYIVVPFEHPRQGVNRDILLLPQCYTK